MPPAWGSDTRGPGRRVNPELPWLGTPPSGHCLAPGALNAAWGDGAHTPSLMSPVGPGVQPRAQNAGPHLVGASRRGEDRRTPPTCASFCLPTSGARARDGPRREQEHPWGGRCERAERGLRGTVATRSQLAWDFPGRPTPRPGKPAPGELPGKVALDGDGGCRPWCPGVDSERFCPASSR